MKYLSAAVCAMAFFSVASFCHAGVIFGGTRIIYPADKNEVQLPIKNKDDDTRHLVQSWVSQPDGTKAPFIVTPPLLKLNEKQETILHIVYTGPKELTNDREKLFTLNIKTVANVPEQLQDKSRLQIAIHSQVKLFFRPQTFTQRDADTAWEKVTFSREGNMLRVKNPTPFFISFTSLTVGGKKTMPIDKTLTPAQALMVSPLSNMTMVIPTGATGSVKWSAINDYGGTTTEKMQPL
ncbi:MULTISPECIES: molecular chaperone [Citrobacter]|uniref:fimbrial biogenesis chaperone n=1 Tax=Citrobacter TaxID=544 RepID=UPI0002675DC5|nr:MULTISPECIES: molecular chaperone [Citrobacter]EIQ78086.1 gram-negative pili assembly chaperone, N-terminal domain protein [Shigella flexneri 1235-66]